MPTSHSTFEEFSTELRLAWRGPNLVQLRTVDSTNRLARRIAEAVDADHGAVSESWIVGYEQTAGRGRLGRHWSSNAGSGIYASLLFPLPSGDDPSSLLRLPIAVGVASGRAVRAMLGVDSVGLKWPNDLLVEGRKLGGILIEVVEGQQQRYAIIGIGLNHSFDASELPDPRATSLRILSDARSTAGEILPSLAACSALLCSTVLDEVESERTIADLMAEYEELSVHRAGDLLTWSSSTGPVEGEFEGFDHNGCIRLRTANGRVTVSAGDVLLTAETDPVGLSTE